MRLAIDTRKGPGCYLSTGRLLELFSRGLRIWYLHISELESKQSPRRVDDCQAKFRLCRCSCSCVVSAIERRCKGSTGWSVAGPSASAHTQRQSLGHGFTIAGWDVNLFILFSYLKLLVTYFGSYREAISPQKRAPSDFLALMQNGWQQRYKFNRLELPHILSPLHFHVLSKYF